MGYRTTTCFGSVACDSAAFSANLMATGNSSQELAWSRWNRILAKNAFSVSPSRCLCSAVRATCLLFTSWAQSNDLSSIVSNTKASAAMGLTCCASSSPAIYLASNATGCWKKAVKGSAVASYTDLCHLNQCGAEPRQDEALSEWAASAVLRGTRREVHCA